MQSVQRLEEACRAGDYYDALQYFNTILTRKCQSPKKDRAECVAQLVAGVAACVTGGNPVAALDVALQLLKRVIPAFNAPFDAIAISNISDVALAICNDKAQAPEWTNARAQFLEEAIRWSRAAKTSRASANLQDVDSLRRLLSDAYMATGRPAMALPLAVTITTDPADSRPYRPNTRGVIIVASEIAKELQSDAERALHALRTGLLFLCHGKQQPLADSARLENVEQASQVFQALCPEGHVVASYWTAIRLCLTKRLPAVACERTIDAFENALHLQDADPQILRLTDQAFQCFELTTRQRGGSSAAGGAAAGLGSLLSMLQ